jgi:hypothetical protein
MLVYNYLDFIFDNIFHDTLHVFKSRIQLEGAHIVCIGRVEGEHQMLKIVPTHWLHQAKFEHTISLDLVQNLQVEEVNF